MITSTSMYSLQGQFSRMISYACWSGFDLWGCDSYSHLNSFSLSARKRRRLSVMRSYEKS